MVKFWKFKEAIISKVAQQMVVNITTPPHIAQITKSLSEATVAFITTSGVRLTSDEPFKTKKGDPTYRVIERDVDYQSLVVDHDHYDTTDATQDLNIVFPLEILKEFADENKIKAVAPRHFGLMGYIPQVKYLINKTSPSIADQLVEDQVDIALFSPG